MNEFGEETDAAAPSAAPTLIQGGGDGYVGNFDFDISFNATTQTLLADAGGIDGLNRITSLFYDKFVKDQHLKRFLSLEGMRHPEVHARRLALYMAEMMGHATQPWSRDLETRVVTPVRLATGQMMGAESRQHAHHMAWHSIQREPEKVGRRFKLDDCRAWMRLFFWAARDAGLTENAPHVFAYLVKWVGHFIAVYEVSARPFTRLEARWSADPANIAVYLQSDCHMLDVADVHFNVAKLQLTEAELESHGSWLTMPTNLSLIGLKM